MQYFLDTSALAKLFHFKMGSDVVHAICHTESNQLFVSSLALLELTSVGAIKVRTGALSEAAAELIQDKISFSLTTGQFLAQRLDDGVLESAAGLLSRYARKQSLRTLDAIHLASAIRRTELSGLLDYFVTADRTLATVARLEGFAVIDPERA